MNVIVQDIPALRAAAVRNVGPYPTVCKAFEKLHAWFEGHPDVCGPETLWFAAFHDCPKTTPPERCRADACISLSPGYPVGDGVEEKVFAGGRFATYLVSVPPEIGDELSKRWCELAGWVAERNLALNDPARPCFEIYYNYGPVSPMRKWVVDLCIPVKPE